VAAGFFLAYASVRLRKRWASVTIEALALPFAAPGTVLAMALILLSAKLAGWGIPADVPLVLLASAYALKYAAVGARSLTARRRSPRTATAMATPAATAKATARVDAARATGSMMTTSCSAVAGGATAVVPAGRTI
jgi:ABC-type Fe3+ transport system permease subunit